MDANAVCIVSIYEASRTKVNYFYDTLLEDNLLWLIEIQDEAKKAFGRESISLLPKTPGIKRKRPILVQQNEKDQESPGKYSSTFVDEAESKKIKIDDMSTIIEASNVSTLDDTQNTSRRGLRPRNKNKSVPRPLKKSRRIANKRASNLNKSIENIKNSTIIISDTPSPSLVHHTIDSGKHKSIVIDDTITRISPINHPVQPHVAALIEQLKLSTQKPSTKSIFPTQNPLDDVKVSLFGEKCSFDESADSTEIFKSPCIPMRECSVNIESFSTPTTTTVPQTPQTVTKSGEASVDSENDTTIQDEIDAFEEINKSDADENETESKDSGVSSDEKQDNEIEEKLHEAEKSSTGRRDTYKVMVQEAQLPCVENTKFQLFNPVHDDIPKIKSLIVNNSSPALTSNQDFLAFKGPKIIKPLTGKNIVTGVKSFISRTVTSPKITREEMQQKKAAELEQKEFQRKKALDETNLRKQRLLELRKKQRADREKRFAEQQALRQEEEERKRVQMEMRNNKNIKNREEVKKQRDMEEKKKKEIREQKTAIAEARRNKEEEEQQRKIREQIEEEERRCEVLKRKMEFEEQERLKKKLQSEKEEKERLRQLEKEKLLHEERKKRELMEKEQHRLEVERKLKEEKEQERLERQKQEQRLRQAEKEIADALKKRELELNQKKHLQTVKPHSPKVTGKENVVKAVHKNSPSLMKATVQCQKINVPLLLPLKLRQSAYTSYDIDDLNSDDSTDDESEPTKRVPSWAQGMELKTQIMHQFYTNLNPDDIFVNCMEPCRLDKIFQKNKERYFKRTSSAHWDSPLLKTKVYR